MLSKTLLAITFAVVSNAATIGPGANNQQATFSADSATKSIAIVGAGSAGLAVLKTFLDLPLEIRREWEFVLFEQRRDVGGVW